MKKLTLITTLCLISSIFVSCDGNQGGGSNGGGNVSGQSRCIKDNAQKVIDEALDLYTDRSPEFFGYMGMKLAGTCKNLQWKEVTDFIENNY